MFWILIMFCRAASNEYPQNTLIITRCVSQISPLTTFVSLSFFFFFFFFFFFLFLRVGGGEVGWAGSGSNAIFVYFQYAWLSRMLQPRNKQLVLCRTSFQSTLLRRCQHTRWKNLCGWRSGCEQWCSFNTECSEYSRSIWSKTKQVK